MLSPSVAVLEVYDGAGQPRASGSAVVVREDGYLVTNWHVVDKGARVEVLVERIRGDEALGHTPDYYEVVARGRGEARPGDTVWMRVDGIREYTLLGYVEGVKEAGRTVALPVV